MDYFNFDEADLEANRKGEYSKAQKKRLIRDCLLQRNIISKKCKDPSELSHIN